MVMMMITIRMMGLFMTGTTVICTMRLMRLIKCNWFGGELIRVNNQIVLS